MTLEDSALLALASRPKLIAEFPFLREAKASKGCGCAAAPAADTNSVKERVAGLSEEARKRFKELAGADSIRVIYRVGSEVRTVDF